MNRAASLAHPCLAKTRTGADIGDGENTTTLQAPMRSARAFDTDYTGHATFFTWGQRQPPDPARYAALRRNGRKTMTPRAAWSAARCVITTQARPATPRRQASPTLDSRRGNVLRQRQRTRDSADLNTRASYTYDGSSYSSRKPPAGPRDCQRIPLRPARPFACMTLEPSTNPATWPIASHGYDLEKVRPQAVALSRTQAHQRRRCS